MNIKRLTLRNFRNYEEQTVLLTEGINIFYGNNAQGKTNLIDAIFTSSMGKSIRAANDRELIHFGRQEAYVLVEFTANTLANSLELFIYSDKKKLIKRNSIPVKKLSELMGVLNCVLFTPDELDIVKEGPALRRRFLDISISQLRPKYYNALVNYNKTLSQKGRLLKDIAREATLKNTLYAWNERLAEYGSLIIWYRQSLINKIEPHFTSYHQDITQAKESSDIKYLPSISYMDGSVNAIQENFLTILSDNMKKEIESGICLYGPHRDDIAFYINGENVKSYGSQGQQRTIILSLKLAQMELIKEDTGEYPVLLLDDITSELDKSRRDYLLGKIKGKQVIITCTDTDRVNIAKDACVYKVQGGTIQKGE